jgi:peptidoglycan lytic transglycosylase B
VLVSIFPVGKFITDVQMGLETPNSEKCPDKKPYSPVAMEGKLYLLNSMRIAIEKELDPSFFGSIPDCKGPTPLDSLIEKKPVYSEVCIMPIYRLKIVIILLLLFSLVIPATRARADFNTWLTEFRQEASVVGISPETLSSHLDNLEPLPKVRELDRSQLVRKSGKRITFNEYLQKVVPDYRIKTARKKYAKNRRLFQNIAARYKVDPAFVMALWAIESDFGRRTGSFPVVGALATLAHDGRREKFFRSELIQLLKLIDDGVITNPEPKGSWAGAMGQVQFMPSSYKEFAIDFDGDGENDLWNSLPDALGSAANYLSRVGWKDRLGWGQEVKLPKNFKLSKTGLNQVRDQKEWRRMGVKGIKGPNSRKAAIILPDGQGGPAFIVYDNFKVIRRWNRSNYFALAVCHLAERIIN